jgi:hypothetical protein
MAAHVPSLPRGFPILERGGVDEIRMEEILMWGSHGRSRS